MVEKRKGFFVGVFVLLVVLSLFSIGVVGLEVDDIGKTVEEKKNDFLGAQWKEVLLNTKVVSGIDGFFQKISIVFKIILGVDYSFSLVVFFAFLAWIIFIVTADNFIKAFSTFSKWISSLLALLIVTIFAQLQALVFVAQAFINIISFKDGVWEWVGFGLVILLVFVVWGYTRRIVWMIGRRYQKTAADRKEWNRKFRMEAAMHRAEIIAGAFK